MTVFLVSNDSAMAEVLRGLDEVLPVRVEVYESIGELLKGYDPQRAGCLVFDTRCRWRASCGDPPIGAHEVAVPVIFATGPQPETRPKDAQLAGDAGSEWAGLRGVVRRVLEGVVQDERERLEQARIADRLLSLTPRERQVMELVVRGKSNKMMARLLGNSARTIEIQRARVMEKMGAYSLSELVRMACALGIVTVGPRGSGPSG